MTDKRRGGAAEPGVVVIGAGLGGLRVCEELRRLGYSGRVTLIGEESELPYDRPPLSKSVLMGTTPNPPVLRSPEELDALDLELRLGASARRLDPQARVIQLEDGQQVGYDALVLATGARPRQWAPVADATNAWTLRNCADAEGIARVLARGGRLCVLGAGFIGSEVASTARELECRVTVVELQDVPMRAQLGQVAGAELERRHREAGVDLRCGVTAENVARDETGAVVAVRLSDGTTVEVDGLVVGLGVEPNVEWLASSGVLLDDGIVCDAAGRTSCPGVFAVGDAARWRNARTGGHRRVEHWSTTVEHAKIVASNLASGESGGRVLDEVPYFWSDQHGIKIQCLGDVGPGTDVTVLLAGPDGGRPLHLHSRQGVLVGAVGFGAPRELMRLRQPIADGAPLSAVLPAMGEAAIKRS